MNTYQVLMKKSPAKGEKHGEKQVSVQIKKNLTKETLWETKWRLIQRRSFWTSKRRRKNYNLSFVQAPLPKILRKKTHKQDALNSADMTDI